ncbi:Chaperone dnaK2 [Paramuricea clavata]|uniref:Chaperone dnaK2 n=1 Tax=Paramuricea clavata TaxID=317549 RepID=A0A7D9JAA4_PARCT|nr:Chaperone dnaK2 [Paramuricea clavata]
MSCTDLLSKFDDLVKRFKEEFKEIVEGERDKMKAEIEAYQAEKQRMKAVDVSDDDIILLNVGGQKFTSTRSTLCQVEGSLLATMFSGRWEDSVKRDQDGAVFFDVNPQYFGYILDYLRTKKIASPENPAELPKVPRDQAKNFNTFVEYLGLSKEIVPTEIETEKLSEKFNSHSPGISIQEDGKVAVHDSSVGHKYVLGENVYQHGITHFKLKLESFQNNNWIMVAILKADVVPQSVGSYSLSGCNGWYLGTAIPGVIENGSHTTNNMFNATKQGDTVELVLDCDGGKLSIHLPTGQQSHIEIPKSQSWRLHVSLLYANDKIRIAEVV